MRERSRLGFGVGLLAIGAVLWLTWPIAVAARRGRSSGRRPRRLVQRPRVPGARVLVVGESPALDACAQSALGVAGRLAEAHPDWTIGSLAPSGSRTTDVARVLGRLSKRLERRGLGAVYDAVVIHTGGADAVRFTREGPLSVSLVVALAAAARVARHTLLVTGGHRALAPDCPRRVSWLLRWRGRRVCALFQAIAWEAGVGYLDLLHGPEVRPTAVASNRSVADAGRPPGPDELWCAAIDAALGSRLSGEAMKWGGRLA